MSGKYTTTESVVRTLRPDCIVDAQDRLYVKRQDLLCTYLAHHWMQSNNDTVIVAMLRHQQHARSLGAPAGELVKAGSQCGADDTPQQDRWPSTRKHT